MGIPKTRPLLLSLALSLALYAAALPLWMASRQAYARGVSATATCLYPLLGLRGGVAVEGGTWTSLTYTLPYPRTGGWGQFRQRLLDFSDLPLVVAVSLGLPLLAWRRRPIAALAAVAAVFACHVGLVLWSALALSSKFADPGIDAAHLEGELYVSASRITGFGNISTVVSLVLVGAVTMLLMPRDLSGGVGPGAPASRSGSAPGAFRATGAESSARDRARPGR